MIGIFDSGLGGLIVVKAILKKSRMPILYFGDTARVPYGTKSREVILKYSIENTKFLIEKGAKAIVIACNTSSAIATEELRKRFKKPIFEVIGPAVKAALKITKKGKIGVIATPATIKSGAYQKRIEKFSKGKIKVYGRACPLIVPLIEEGLLDDNITRELLRRYLKPLKQKKVDVLILGCTHYPLIESLISEEMGKKVKIISSAEAVVGKLESFLKDNSEGRKSRKENVKIFLSDEGYNFNEISKKIFKKKITRTIIKN